MSAREDLIDFVLQYGGRCRDCADEAGFCPQTGIGCGQRRKAVEFVLGAIEYGVKHGFVSGYTIIRDDENHKATVERCELAAYSTPAYVIGALEVDENGIMKPGSIYDQGRYDARLSIRSLIKEDGE